jgi:hypothetical protein
MKLTIELVPQPCFSSPRIAQRDGRRAKPELRSESCSEQETPLRESRNNGMERKKGRKEGRTKRQAGKKARRLLSEKQASPRR